jgi:DNA repair protein RadD
MQLRTYQRLSVEAAYRYLQNYQGNPVICLPTGAGKSIVIAELARIAVQDFGGRVLVLQHRKELIEQNAEKIRALLPGIEVGLFSAALKQRECSQDVVVGGIQSIYKHANLLGRRNLIVIDECHLCSDNANSMYGKLLADIASLDYSHRVVGLTATPYRTESGKIYGVEKLFTDIIEKATVPQLIKDGYLCPIVNTDADASVDTSDLHKRGGEFIQSEVEQLFGNEPEIEAAVNEILQKTANRHSVMVFCTSVMHAKTVANMIYNRVGLCVDLITGESTSEHRRNVAERFRSLQLKYLVNVDVLTTGFDAPVVDAIAILRATASPGLYVQIVGRGLRTHASKTDCLVLDFGENIRRHGAIDRVRGRPKAPKETEPKEQAEGEEDEEKQSGKMCPACEVYSPPSETHCECGYRFPVVFRHNDTAEREVSIISDGKPRVYNVRHIVYGKSKAKDRPASMTVLYIVQSGEKTRLPDDSPMEFVAFESDKPFAVEQARRWWAKRTILPFPQTTDEALAIAKSGELGTPSVINAERDGRYWKITTGPTRKDNEVAQDVS